MKRTIAQVLAASLALVLVLTACDDLTSPLPDVLTANAGSDQTVDLGATVTLDGSGSIDPDGLALTYSWTMDAVPTGSALATTSIANATSATASFVPDVIGEFQFTLTVNNGEDEATDGLVITVVENTGDLAQTLADEAVALLEAQDYDGAYSKFSQAVAADSSNGLAVLGYATMSVASVATDPGVVGLATTNLGIVGYPDTMNTLFTDTWLELIAEPDDGIPETYEASYLGPEISGQYDTDSNGALKYDLNGDDFLDPGEKFLAFIAYFAANNPTGFNDIVDSLATVLIGQLDSALTAIDLVPAGAEIGFTWDMFYDTEEEAELDGWPQTPTGTLITMIIGREEALLIGASMQMFRSYVHMAQVYDYTLPLDDYWNAVFNDLLPDGTIDDPVPASPFAGTFLEASADATAALAAAKADLEGALNDIIEAINGITSRTSTDDYALSPSSDFLVWDGLIWSEFETATNFVKAGAQETLDSLTAGSPTPAVYPNGSDIESYPDFIAWADAKIGAWPTSTDVPDSAYSFDFGTFFSMPQTAISSILDLRSTSDITSNDIGEPVLYEWNAGTETFGEVTTAPDLQATIAPLYLKVLDASLGGSLDLSNLPIDDPTTRYSIGTSLHYDANGNSLWDSGVDEIDLWLYAQIEGLIQKPDIAADYGGDPSAYYAVTLADVPDSELEPFVADVGNDGKADDVAALRSYLGQNLRAQFNVPIAVLDGTSTSVYINPLPAAPETTALLAWHSFTEADAALDYDGDGTPDDLNSDGATDTSTGSFWFGLAEFF